MTTGAYQSGTYQTGAYQTVPVTSGYQTLPAGHYYTTTVPTGVATTAEKKDVKADEKKTFLETDDQVDGEVSVWMVLVAALICLALYAVLMYHCQKRSQGAPLMPETELRSHETRA